MGSSSSTRARIAVFPKCFLPALVTERSLTWEEWVRLAADLPHVEGVELYPAALASTEPDYLQALARCHDAHGLSMPMTCASPDFTKPDPRDRSDEIARYKAVLDVVAALGGETCRILSGQRRPDVRMADGMRWTLEAIEAVLPHAESRRVRLVLENHYKDGFWDHPELAQKREQFLEIALAIDSPWFGVNFDPSNALLAGEDPIELLEAVKDRVVTIHASDRHLRARPQSAGSDGSNQPTGDDYDTSIEHGVIGTGLVDYDRLLSILAATGFSGWISIEDGVDPTRGLLDLHRSAEYLHGKLVAHGLAAPAQAPPP